MNYYQVLHDAPQLLHKFYKPDSIFYFGAEGSADQRAVGQEDINQKILSMKFSNCKVRLSVVEAQDSVEGSVLIFVKGNLTNDGTPSTEFVQTFLLAAQQPSGYYVRNDILRYSAPLPAPQKSDAAKIPANDIAGRGAEDRNEVEDKGQSKAKEPTEVRAKPASGEGNIQASSQKNKQTTNNVTANGSEIPREEPSQHVVGPSPSSLENRPQHDEAARAPSASSAKEDGVRFEGQTAPTSASKEPDTPSSWAALAARAAPLQPQTRPPPSAAVKAQKAMPTKEEAHEQSHPPPTASTALYINSLPFSCTRNQIEQLFSVYGQIKTIALPPNKKGYAFVDYVSPDSVAKAIKATHEQPLVLEGRRLKIEQRKNKQGRPRDNKNKRPKDPRESKDSTPTGDADTHQKEKAPQQQKGGAKGTGAGRSQRQPREGKNGNQSKSVNRTNPPASAGDTLS